MIYSVLLSLPFLLTFIITQLFFFAGHRSKRQGRVPPTAPYVVPLFGHTFSVLRNALIFACTVTYVHSQPADTSYVNE